MYCSVCGRAVAQGLSYCNYCGAKLNGVKDDSVVKSSEPKPEMLVAAMVLVEKAPRFGNVHGFALGHISQEDDGIGDAALRTHNEAVQVDPASGAASLLILPPHLQAGRQMSVNAVPGFQVHVQQGA